MGGGPQRRLVRGIRLLVREPHGLSFWRRAAGCGLPQLLRSEHGPGLVCEAGTLRVPQGQLPRLCKQLDRYASTATFAMGSQALYRFLHNNPGVNLAPVDYTNEPRVICRQDNMVTINSALQVDLFGQVAADTIGKLQYSGVGGQVDFVRGCNMSKNGRNIIALPSTAKHGSVSRISLQLPQYGTVTTGRFDVDYIITEYGVAKLWGKTLEQRAEALIAIAHPDFREILRKEYQAL